MSTSTLTVAFLVTQFILLFIVFAGVLILKTGEKRVHFLVGKQDSYLVNLLLPILAFTLMSLAVIAFSNDLVNLSQPAFGEVPLPFLTRDIAFLSVFILDIAGTGLLITLTVGVKESPFTSVLLALPALSIFLRESPERFFTYTGLAIVLFILASKINANKERIIQNSSHLFAYQVVTLGCLALTSLIGYATRPA